MWVMRVGRSLRLAWSAWGIFACASRHLPSQNMLEWVLIQTRRWKLHACGISWLQTLMRCSWQPSMLLGSQIKAPLGPLPPRKLVKHAPMECCIAQWGGMPGQLLPKQLAVSRYWSNLLLTACSLPCRKQVSCRYLSPAQLGSAEEDSNDRTSSVSAMSESLRP